MQRRTLLATLAASSALLMLAGCAPAPEKNDAKSSSSECARMVTNSGGLHDRSFNESSWQGIQAAEKKFGIKAQAIESKSQTDLAPNVAAAVQTGCGFILTVGYELADATKKEAEKNPDVDFAIVDDTVEAKNVKPIVFNTAEASYLAGYLAAGVTKTGKVATFGGGQQPPVTLFMDGFADGVEAYNTKHGTQVQVLGWNVKTQNGSFTGDFEDVNKGKTTAQNLLDQGADVIMPVAGQVGEGAASAIADRKEGMLIWVDNDGYQTLREEYRPYVLTSVMKNSASAISTIIDEHLKKKFSSEPYVGTLKNDGVGLAPFHDLDQKVPAELKTEIEQVKQSIESGDTKVESKSAP